MRERSVLVVGSGAREHALARRLAEEGAHIVCAPGNPGTAGLGENQRVDIADVRAMIDFAREKKPDFVLVGPELPLALGLADALREAGIAVFGPSKAAAALEGSKAFMKRICKEAGVPTAAFEIFDDADRAESYVRSAKRPLVVKADGLAAGKGVTVASSTDEACEAVDLAMRKKIFGDAGKVVVIEELLTGREASFHVVCSANSGRAAGLRAQGIFPLFAAQDHKRIFDGDRGPNTGGMGAYAPAPLVTPEIESKILERIVLPALEAMKRNGTPFTGVLFAGVMIDRGEPTLLEFNVRFGDPETSVLAPLTEGLCDLLYAAATGASLEGRATRAAGAAVSVVMASEGYPGTPKVGDAIEGLDAAGKVDGAHVLQAGTKCLENGSIVTSGGRVLNVVGTGSSFEIARDRAYAAVDKINFRGAQIRRDIGTRR
ncbi:MAG: phosphoribosylamine--glycine ligase [Polyangiaceae bacterium]